MNDVRGWKGLLAAALAVAMPLLTGGVDRDSAFAERILASHNRERSALGVQPLKWDERLAAQAQAWADHLARTGRFDHSPAGPFDRTMAGENLWAGTAGAYAPEEMVGYWINEKADFKPGVFPAVSHTGDLQAVGHYTQLIWRETTRVGCGVARSGDDDILVCRYLTSGNVIGERVI
ncbi:SCP-like extracellular [Sphingomonas sp. ID1715]|uniref:CAP family protein n=1 Tax=Sphingomonas sp. ID1715 TaxID=1656898 RepID=UPI001489D3C6|nr:CAP family protein [Sphingomonas sp. ID1715]NNM76145.1 SCP-like extracellular [Sphingomonas sp. ID1715]